MKKLWLEEIVVVCSIVPPRVASTSGLAIRLRLHDTRQEVSR